MRVTDMLAPGTLERIKQIGPDERDWSEPFSVVPVSVHPEGLNPYEHRVVDANGIVFAKTAFREKAELIALLPALLKANLVAVQLEAAVSTCDACLDADENICAAHAAKADELSEFRLDLLMKTGATEEKP